MADTKTVVDGVLKITKTPDVTIETMDRVAVVGKIAEIQTKIDHLKIDLAAEEAEKAIWVASLAEMGK